MLTFAEGPAASSASTALNLQYPNARLPRKSAAATAVTTVGKGRRSRIASTMLVIAAFVARISQLTPIAPKTLASCHVYGFRYCPTP